MPTIFRKTIKLFLIDGETTGRMSAELSNWTGKAYKIPRNKVRESKDRTELNGTGVYFLFGKDEDQNDAAYIGEAEDVLKRLNQHLKEKDFWNEVIVLTSKDDNLNKAHIKYLEHHFYQLAKKVGRYQIENSTIPALPSISEPDQAEMEEFLLNSKQLIGTLGHKIFEEEVDRDDGNINNEALFYIKSARGSDASMVRSSEGFVVLKGSKFANPVVDSFSQSSKKLRQSLIDKQELVFKDNELILVKDRVFSSPSTAADMVTGRSANGLIEWKLKNGKTLREVESVYRD
ncbi:GIY-YIG nuclease family protein [Jeotgalibacillus marinus]|uniref:GIY-YIG nuclease family protein n=1 Tax=Jeotgalibacillus marinus TaxID=86667 RepID=A0ABV3Q7W0_9BACL